MAVTIGSEQTSTETRVGASATNGEITSAAIRDALDRVSRSRTFRRSERLVHFLRFLVEESLSGHAAQLKQTIIGVWVCGRTPDYDPKNDAIVRTQAWRTRSKLKRYYESEGAEDPVIISLLPGHYAPIFSVRQSAEPDNTPRTSTLDGLKGPLG